MESHTGKRCGISVSNLPIFSFIFSDLNILFSLPRTFSTAHSYPHFCKVKIPAQSWDLSLDVTFPMDLSQKTSRVASMCTCSWPLQDGKTYFPATESPVVNLFFRKNTRLNGSSDTKSHSFLSKGSMQPMTAWCRKVPAPCPSSEGSLQDHGFQWVWLKLLLRRYGCPTSPSA